MLVNLETKKTMLVMIIGSILVTIILFGNPLLQIIMCFVFIISGFIIEEFWFEKEKETQTTLGDTHF